MKNKILITILIVIIAGAIAWFFSQGKNGKIADIKDPNIQEQNTKTTIVLAEKPVSLDGIEMLSYRSPMGYEITYPKAWVSVLAPKGTSPNVEDYAIYPKEIPYGPSPVIDISVSKKSLSDLLSKLQIRVENLEKISINGFEGYKWLKTDRPSIDYFFELSGLTYRVIYWYSPEYDIPEQEALWALSTFKITK